MLKKHGYKSFEEMSLRVRANPGDGAIASATTKRFQFSHSAGLKANCLTAGLARTK
jgi:hypothetical protein